jgi:hypothetical protein
MALYPLLVFLHVVAGVVFVASIGFELITVIRLRTATVDEARTLVWLLTLRTRAIGPAMAVVLVTGAVMAVTRWGMPPWMVTALAAVAVLAATGVSVIRRTVRVIERALAQPEPSTAAVIHHAAARRALRITLAVRAGVTVGILGLMTIRPGVTGAVAIALGPALVGALAAARPSRALTHTSQLTVTRPMSPTDRECS